MIGAMIPEISRLQRVILAFNPASRSRRVLVGGPVMVQADNAEASGRSSHKISSNLNCRVCIFGKRGVDRWEGLVTPCALRVLRITKSWGDECGRSGNYKADRAAIKLPHTATYKIPGLDPHQDLPYDNLHRVLLGYVQMLWAETVKDRRVKPDLEDLDLRTAAASRDGGIQSMVGGKRIINWSGSLQGGDFRSIIQLWPSTLLSFYESKGRLSQMQDLIHL
ncbi:hypothetical protein K470DRAFT_9449 [Piedraia hortae CBS 480.64]|uniref:Uncharacterized protein n=1 Tax=Piedraia hortae CBS 480.64 TaxID=1314780 RepID=A0A6A7C548_9PEZI|nr:hypothetical protein K470DRAFT_9449 [Piedraia hortae CBS 480.64]